MTLLSTKPKLNEAALRDPSRPVHRIADDLLPYLRVLVDEFAPQHVILFGSYAYGTATEDSDLDLLVVKDTEEQPHIRDRIVRQLVRDIRVPTDILVYTPNELLQWKTVKASFENYILQYGKELYGRIATK